MVEVVEINPEQCEKCIHGYVCHMGVSLNPILFSNVEKVECCVFLSKELVFKWKKAYDSSM